MEKLGNFTEEQYKRLLNAIYPDGYALSPNKNVAVGLFNGFHPMKLFNENNERWNIMVFYVLDEDDDYREVMYQVRKLIDNCGFEYEFLHDDSTYHKDMCAVDIYINIYPDDEEGNSQV